MNAVRHGTSELRKQTGGNESTSIYKKERAAGEGEHDQHEEKDPTESEPSLLAFNIYVRPEILTLSR